MGDFIPTAERRKQILSLLTKHGGSSINEIIVEVDAYVPTLPSRNISRAEQ